jgi:hypothetical protein
VARRAIGAPCHENATLADDGGRMTYASSISLDPRSTGLFVDGDNLSSAYAPALLGSVTGQPRIARVYGSAAALKGWAAHAAFEPVLSAAATPTRNATDMTLALDALHLAMTERLTGVVLASSDGDFTPLARTLRRLGLHVLARGEAKTPQTFRRACSQFQPLDLPKPVPKPAEAEQDKVVEAVQTVLGGEWKLLGTLAKEVKDKHGYDRNTPGVGQWSKWLRTHSDLFEFEDCGATSRVRRRAQCASASPLPNAPVAFSTTGISA